VYVGFREASNVSLSVAQALISATTPFTPNETTQSVSRHEECPREIIPYDQFPDDVQAEIDAAFEGRHEADRVYLREAIDTDESYVSVDGDYYEAEVTEEGDRLSSGARTGLVTTNSR
jgi:hypothetical protein